MGFLTPPGPRRAPHPTALRAATLPEPGRDFRRRFSLPGFGEGRGGVAGALATLHRRHGAPPGGPAQMGADQRQRELARQHFIVGEPRPRFAFMRQIGGRGRPVQGRQRRGKIRPLRARRVGRIEPLRQHRNGGERRRDGAAQRVLREPLGERIERLDQRHAGELGGIDHALGMHHLQHAVIGFDGAGDIAQLPQRQHPFDLLLAQREISDRQRPGVVGGVDLERRARPVRRRRPIAFGGDRDRHGGAGHDIAQFQLQAAIDRAGRHVEHEIEHARAVRAADEAGIQPLGLAGDAGKRRDGGEQRVEQGRAHGGRYCAGSGREYRSSQR